MADRYWVGNGGNITDNTNHWSATSGGSAGASLPGSTDNVFFDANSFSSASQIVTVDGAFSCADFVWTGATNTPRLSGSAALNVYGAFTLIAAMQYNFYTGTLTFRATSGTKAITSAGNSYNGVIVFNGVGGTWQLADDLSFQTNGSIITLTNGSFDPNGKTVTIAGTSSGQTITGAFTFYNLVRAGAANKTDSLTFTANVSVTNLLTLTGDSAINRLLIKSDTLGTARTITAAAISVDKCDFQDITGAGAASWDMSAAVGYTGNCGGNTMKALGTAAFTTAATQTATGTASFTWSTHGWTSRVPLPQDDVVINNAFVAGRTITVDMPRLGKSIDMSSATGTPTFNVTTTVANFGSITIPSGITCSDVAQTWSMSARANCNLSIQSTWKTGIIVNTLGFTTTLTNNLEIGGTQSRSLNLASGTFDSGSYSVTSNLFVCTTTLTKVLNMGSGTWTGTSTGTVWNFATVTGLTLNAQTSTIKFNDTSSTGKTFAGGGMSYNIFWYAPSAGTATLTLSGSNTFGELKDDGSASHSILFTAGTTTTVTTWTITGDASHTITIGSATASNHTLSKSSGTVSVSYCSISRSQATGGASWQAYTSNNNTDGGNNSGWAFSATGVKTANGLAYASVKTKNGLAVASIKSFNGLQ